MQLHIIARGKIGRSPEAELTERYLKRIAWPTKVTELPDRGGSGGLFGVKFFGLAPGPGRRSVQRRQPLRRRHCLAPRLSQCCISRHSRRRHGGASRGKQEGGRDQQKGGGAAHHPSR